jgi:hypothetical protein
MSMIVSVSLPDRILETSGTLYLTDQDLRFTIQLSDVVFAFEFEAYSGPPAMRYQVSDDQKNVQIFLRNWNNVLGTGNLFKDIATVAEATYSIGLYVSALGETPNLSRIIHYSVYRTVSQ